MVGPSRAAHSLPITFVRRPRRTSVATIALVLAIPTVLLAGSLAIGSHQNITTLSPFATLDAGEMAATSDGSAAGLVGQVLANPSAICVENVSSCQAGTDNTQVNVSFQAQGTGIAAWSAVQVLFVLETTPYDGVFDGSGNTAGSGDPCWGRSESSGVPDGPLCDESNGVPFFVENAANIAESLQLDHPSTVMTFGLADYGSSDDQYDDSNGSIHPVWNFQTGGTHNYTTEGWAGPESAYRVDIGNFVRPDDFGSAVASTFQRAVLGGGYDVLGSNMSTNILHSDSITALFGALAGVGLNWSPDAHHVIVWVGSTAPEAPGYVQNYCVSGSYWAPLAFGFVGGDGISRSNCLGNDSLVSSPNCEPAYTFEPGVTMPACVGWAQAQGSNSSGSIANLASSAPSCSSSLGGNCTIDSIDLFATPTDGESLGWFAPDLAYGAPPYPLPYNGSDYGEWWPLEDAHRVISAGCDLANATGGTWDGPTIDSCGPGRSGTLSNVPYGPRYFDPNTSNPTLFSAIVAIGLGDPPPGQIALGSSSPFFTFVPLYPFELNLQLPISAHCQSSILPTSGCQSAPSIHRTDRTSYLTWNWSTNPSLNEMYSGDLWTASLSVFAVGGPFGVLEPVDACVTAACIRNGSGSIGGLYSEASYQPAFSAYPAPPLIGLSLPPALVLVEATPSQSPGTNTPPPPPSPGPGLPVPTPVSVPLPISVPVGVAATVVVCGISIQAVGAGALSAGFARVVLQRRAVAVGQPVGNGVRPKRSAFEEDGPTDVSIGRFD